MAEREAAMHRLAEPLAALSVATDIARGQPPEQALRACVMATRLVEYLGLGTATRSDVYYGTLLRFAGCTATSHEYAEGLGGNDITVRFAGDATDIGDHDQILAFLAAVGRSPDALPDSLAVVVAGTRADCEVGSRIAMRLGLGERVAQSLLHIFERWDGHGLPNGVEGADIPLEARISHVASVAAMFTHARGAEEAIRIVREWSGGVLDPTLVDSFLDHSAELLACMELPDPWVAVLDAEPVPRRRIQDAELDEICEVFGAFVDLKTPYHLGHSAHVARLAEEAGRTLGLAEGECLALRRAGLLHDLGRVGISTGIWEKPEPLTSLEAEQAQLHPYHSERILERCSVFRDLSRLAGEHHERIDGSGYFRGLLAPSLDRRSRILAAADACAELLEARPGRDALTPKAVGATLSTMPLDADAVDAVLQAAGAPSPTIARSRPAGLTRREVEVLRLLARGRTLSQVAEELVISESTAHTHAAHVYEKAGVSTRAGAAVFAMEHGLLA